MPDHLQRCSLVTAKSCREIRGGKCGCRGPWQKQLCKHTSTQGFMNSLCCPAAWLTFDPPYPFLNKCMQRKAFAYCTVKRDDFLYALLSFMQYFNKLFVSISYMVFFLCRCRDVLYIAVKWFIWNFVFSCEHVIAKTNLRIRFVYCEETKIIGY